MIEKIAYRLSQLMYPSRENPDSFSIDDLEILQYGIECIINTLIPLSILFLYSLVTHSVIDMLIWLITFLCLRNYFGGYHASSHIKCMLLSTIWGIVAIIIATNLSTNYIGVKLMILLCFFVYYYVNGPILQNNSDNSLHNRIFIKGCVIFLVQFTVIIFLLINDCLFGNDLFIGICSTFILYIIEKINPRQ